MQKPARPQPGNIPVNFDSQPSAVVIVGPDGFVAQVNDHAETLFGRTRPALTGRPLETLFAESQRPAGADHLRLAVTAPAGHAATTRVESFVCRNDGSQFPVAIELISLPTPAGNYLVAVIDDIAARRTSEDRFMHSAAAVELRSRELDEFACAAAHDLQAPLRKLVAFSELLKEDLGLDLPSTAAQDIDQIRTAAACMQNLVNDLLALSQAGRGSLATQPVSLDLCVDRALETLSLCVAETEAVIHRPAVLPTVDGDPSILTQLFQNLICNALKFSRPGEPPLIELTDESCGGERVLGVRDHGLGIPQDALERVFQPFVRLQGAAHCPGSGLGLAICQKAVFRHRGRIWVESLPGGGAHFRFTLGTAEPADPSRAGAEPQATCANHSGAGWNMRCTTSPDCAFFPTCVQRT